MREKYHNGEYTEATTSFTPCSPHGGYSGVNDLFLFLSLYTQFSHYTHTTTKVVNNNTTFALSHIYTDMTFVLFTHMAPGGPQEHIYTRVSFQSVGRITTGP